MIERIIDPDKVEAFREDMDSTVAKLKQSQEWDEDPLGYNVDQEARKILSSINRSLKKLSEEKPHVAHLIGDELHNKYTQAVEELLGFDTAQECKSLLNGRVAVSAIRLSQTYIEGHKQLTGREGKTVAIAEEINKRLKRGPFDKHTVNEWIKNALK